MSTHREHAYRGKPGTRPELWRVMHAQHAFADREFQPVRICRVLQVNGQAEEGLAAVAAAQRGVVHREQLAELGIRRGAIAHRVSIGSLHRVFPAVYAVGHPALAPWALETAALLYGAHLQT